MEFLGLTKNGKDSSILQDFMAGVEPSGTITFGQGLKNKSRHGIHKAVGAAGGFVGGATAIPAVIHGLIKGVPNAINMKGAPFGKRIGAIGAAAIAPYRMIYHALKSKPELAALRAGKDIDPKNLKKTLDSMPVGRIKKLFNIGNVGRAEIDGKIFVNSDYIFNNGIRKGMVGEMLKSDKTYNKIRSSINTNTTKGLSMLGMAGGINSLSAVAQYNSALKARAMNGK